MAAPGGRETDVGQRHAEQGFRYNGREKGTAMFFAILWVRSVSTKLPAQT